MAIDATKLAPPRPSVRPLHRQRLLDVIDTTPDRGLCAITGGPGFGKTQLLGELAGRSDAKVAWLTVETADNDPSQFWTYLTEACLRAWQITVEERVERPAIADADSFVEAALDHAGDEAVWIVIDDAHLLVDATLQTDLGRVAQRLPAGARMAVASRRELPWVPPKWRAAGTVVDVRERALALNEDEFAELVRLAELDVSPEVVDQLRARTEGLPAVVQLAIRAALDADDPETFIRQLRGDDQSIADFLLQEALDNQPSERRQFLLETSILDRLTGTLCDAVTGRGDGAGLLRDLERSHALVNRLEGGETPWYRYHALFAELLRAELRAEHPGVVDELHLRAGAWHAEHGDPDRAFEHLVAGGDAEAAAAIVFEFEDEYFRLLRAATLHRWYSALPATLDDPDDHLLRLVWADLAQKDTVRAEATLAQLRRLALRPSAPMALAAELAVIDAHLAAQVGDAPAVALHAPQAIDGFAAEGIGLERPAVAYVTLLAARADVWDGRLDDAQHRLDAALANPTLTDPYWIHALRGALALVDAQRGDLGTALDRAEQVLTWQASNGAPSEGSLEALLARVMALRSQQRRDECTRAIADARKAADLIASGAPFKVALGIEAAWLDLQRGDLDAAGGIIDGIEDLPRFAAGERNLAEVREAWRESVRRREGVTDLTAREREVLALLPSRLTLQEIADQLYVSANTVKTHVKSIYVKLNVTNRDEATARAAELRLPLPSPDR